MTDYISRADAIEVVCKLCVDGQTAKVDGYFIPIRDALENVLKALPSADAVSRDVHVGIVNELVKRIEELKADSVKVVRCKDCRHRYTCNKSVNYTKHDINSVCMGSFAVDYCSHGERAEQTDEKISIDEIKDYVHSVFKSAEEFINPITESPNDVIESENDVIDGDCDFHIDLKNNKLHIYAEQTKYPATYNIDPKCGGCVHLDELGRCLNFMLAKPDRSCWRGSWENNMGGERREE